MSKPYAGVNIPLAGAEEGDPPLLRLVKKLYTEPEPMEHTPSFEGELDLFPMAHDAAILREPFRNAAGACSRACLMGDSCVGRDSLLPGHAESGGVVLTEIMSPAELAAFREHGALPSERRTCLLCARMNVHTAYLFARKRRTFPPNALLNNFVNAAGEGEYAAEFLVPSPDDSSWSGVLGTVAGLHLNALRLVQEPDKSWRVDQSAMEHVTRTPCNVTFPSMYRELVPPPHAYLRAFFSHRARVSDATVLFFSYEELVEARPKLPAPPSDASMPWPPGATKSFAHRLLFYRVNRLNQMLAECAELYGRTWAYNMQLYIDAHVGMVLLVERGEALSAWELKYTAHEHALPDLGPLCVQAAVNSVVPEGLSVAERKKAMARPRAVAAQMLIRALPEFSQARWLHTLFVSCLQNRELSSTMFALAQAALLGNYVQSPGPPAPYATRKAFIAGFTQQNAAAIFGAMPPNEHLTLYVMATYNLATIMPLCPALQKLVSAMSPMQAQAHRVFEAMQALRDAARNDWRLMFGDAALEALKKAHKRMPKRKLVPRGLSDVSAALAVSASRTAARRGLKRKGAAFDPDFFEAQLQRLRRGAPPEPALAAASGAAAGEVLAALGEDPHRATSLAFAPETIGDADAARLADYAAAEEHVRLARATPLPAGFVRRQREAVARRFGCGPEDWDTLRRVTRVAICVSCGVRNFFLTQAERGASKRRVDNVRAAGFRKLAHNLEAGDMRCVAGESCPKHTLSYVDLASEDGSGGALVLRGAAVVVSPCCGYACASSSIRVTPTGFDCPACCVARKEEAEGAPDPRICAHCGKRSQLRQAMEQTVLLRDDHGRVLQYGFCRSHMRPWARTQSGYLTLSFVSKNMTNRSGNGLVRNPT